MNQNFDLPNFLFIVGTVANWIGLYLIGAAIYRAIDAGLNPAGTPKERSMAALGANLAGAAAALVAGFLLTSSIHKPKEAGLMVPLFWPVLPFNAWASLILGVLFVVRFVRIGLERLSSDAADPSAKNPRAKVLTVIGYLAGSIFFGWLHKSSGDPVSVMSGYIPLTPTFAISFLVLLLAAFVLMSVAGRAAKARNVGKTLASHLVLITGSFVFGLPFAWALITSFKEEQDMSSPNGLVWVPHVSQTMPYRNPDDPMLKIKFKGQDATATLIEKEPNGLYRVEIQRPKVLLGQTAEVDPKDAVEVDRDAPVVSGAYQGQKIKGIVIKEMEDGKRQVKILEPASLAGQVFAANPSDVDAVRSVGLKTSNYRDALEYLPPESNFGLTYLRNTVILVLLNIFGTVGSSAIVAYAFSRLRFPGKGLMFTVLLATMMLPAAVTLMPRFLIFRSLGWIDTLHPLYVTAFLGSAFNIFMLRQFFNQVPKELEDAAKIDGCTYLKTFFSVMAPQVKPALAVIAVWTFVGVWNDFLGPLIYINSPEKMTVSYALQLYQGERFGEPGLLMAFAMMGMAPVLLVFFFAQRYFIEGVSLSGLGGR